MGRVVVADARCWPLGACRRPTEATITADVVTLNNRAVGADGAVRLRRRGGRVRRAADTAEPAWPGARLNHRHRAGEPPGARAMPTGPKPNCARWSTCPMWIGAPATCWRCCWRTKAATTRRGRCCERLADEDPPDGFAAYFAAQQRLTSSAGRGAGLVPAGRARASRCCAAPTTARSSRCGAWAGTTRRQGHARALPGPRAPSAGARGRVQVHADGTACRKSMTVDVAAGSLGDRSRRPPFPAAGASILGGASAAWRPGRSARSITIADIDGDGASISSSPTRSRAAAPNAVAVAARATLGARRAPPAGVRPRCPRRASGATSMTTAWRTSCSAGLGRHARSGGSESAGRGPMRRRPRAAPATPAPTSSTARRSTPITTAISISGWSTPSGSARAAEQRRRLPLSLRSATSRASAGTAVRHAGWRSPISMATAMPM